MRRLGECAFAMIWLVVSISSGIWDAPAVFANESLQIHSGFVETESRGSYSESAQFLPITDVFAEDEARAGWPVDVDGPTAVLGAPLADVVNISQ